MSYSLSYSGRLRWTVLSLALVLFASAGPARADDLEDLFENLITPLGSFGVTTAWDCNVNGLCPGSAALSDVTFPELDTSGLSNVTSSIVNDRIVPLSSSVTGFTYEYNEDLDVYDRSTKTFGPLFSERA